MTNKIFSSLKVITLAVVLSFGLSYVYAWTAPTVAPTGGNVTVPINTSTTAQSKAGNFTAPNLIDTSTTAQTKNGGLTVSSITAPSHCIGTSCITTWPTSGSTPPTGSTFLDTSSTAQTKAGGLTVGELTTTLATKLSNSDIYFTKTDHNHTGIGNTAGYAAIENASDYNTLMILGRANGIGGVRSVSIWDRLDVNGTIKATGGYIGNGPTPLTPHYINRSEDSYGAWPGYWQYRYCNGWYNHDTCPGNNVDYPYTCGVSAQTTCVDSYSNNPADTGWCGRYFQDRTVTCNINEVLSTYDI